MSDTDEYSDGSDDDTEVDFNRVEEDDETDVEEENVSLPNKDKNHTTISETSSANSHKCTFCKRVYFNSSSLQRHIMAIHRPNFVECPVSSCKKKIKSNQLSEHLRRIHNNINKSPKVSSIHFIQTS